MTDSAGPGRKGPLAIGWAPRAVRASRGSRRRPLHRSALALVVSAVAGCATASDVLLPLFFNGTCTCQRVPDTRFASGALVHRIPRESPGPMRPPTRRGGTTPMIMNIPGPTKKDVKESRPGYRRRPNGESACWGK